MIHISQDTSIRNYQTFSVYDGDTHIGAIQCKGVCVGDWRSRNNRGNHEHGPWITFVGPNNTDARNFGPLINDKDEAVLRVVERHNETIQGT